MGLTVTIGTTLSGSPPSGGGGGTGGGGGGTATGNNRLVNPSAFGYPDGTNCLDVPTSSLTVVNGNFATTQDGQIVEGLWVKGSIAIKHQDVQLISCLGDYAGTSRAVNDTSSTVGRWSASHCKFMSSNPGSTECLYLSRADLNWVEANGSQDISKTLRNFSNYDNVYFHDPLHPAGAHSDCIQIVSGGADVQHSTLIAYTGGNIGDWASSWNTATPIGNPNNSCMQVSGGTGPITTINANDCLMDGGNYTISGYSTTNGTFTPTQSITIQNSRFGHDYRYGTHASDSDPNTHWINNVFDLDGSSAAQAGNLTGAP